ARPERRGGGWAGRSAPGQPARAPAACGAPAAIRPRAHERGTLVPGRQGRPAGGAHDGAGQTSPSRRAAEVGAEAMTPRPALVLVALLVAAAPLSAQPAP